MYLNAASIPMFIRMLAVTSIAPDDRSLGILQAEAEHVIATGDGGNQREVKQVPFRVEEIVREKDQAQREDADSRDRPVQEKDGGEEDEVRRGGKQQITGYSRIRRNAEWRWRSSPQTQELSQKGPRAPAPASQRFSN